MHQRSIWLFVPAVLALGLLLPGRADAQKKPITPIRELKGSVADENLMKGAPTVITSAEGLKKVWDAWKLEDKMPQVDFGKEIVVVTTTRGSRLNLRLMLDDKENLQVLGLATRDLRPGFRYVMAIVSRDGVKTVDGKPLPQN
jgi:hypothetical protein